MPLRIDQSLINAYIPDDMKDVINQVQSNVSDGVDTAIDQFRDSIKSRADAFANGAYDSQFEASVEKIKTDAQTQLMATHASFAELQKSVATLKKAVASANTSGTSLSASVTQLSDNADKLNAALQAMDDKITNFASQGARLVVGGLTKALLG